MKQALEFRTRPVRAALAGLAVACAAVAMPGCAPLVVGGAMVGGGMMAVDRRTAGTQVEDQAIELKGAERARQASSKGHVNLTSYNRMLLITGEVPTEADKRAVEQALSQVEHVRSVVNELAVAPNSALSGRSADAVVTGKVKAAFIDAKDLQAQAFKVVTERGTVYLMGLVTEREATRATEIARSTSGVKKVVRVIEVISEADLARIQTK